MAKVTIEVPDGYEVQVVEKKKEEQKEPVIRTYQDLINNKITINGYLITSASRIEEYSAVCDKGEKDVAASVKVAKSMIAMAMISQLMPYYGGEITDEEWSDSSNKYVLARTTNNITFEVCSFKYHFLAFHTAEQLEEFYRNNKRLIKDYLMID